MISTVFVSSSTEFRTAQSLAATAPVIVHRTSSKLRYAWVLFQGDVARVACIIGDIDDTLLVNCASRASRLDWISQVNGGLSRNMITDLTSDLNRQVAQARHLHSLASRTAALSTRADFELWKAGVIGELITGIARSFTGYVKCCHLVKSNMLMDNESTGLALLDNKPVIVAFFKNGSAASSIDLFNISSTIVDVETNMIYMEDLISNRILDHLVVTPVEKSMLFENTLLHSDEGDVSGKQIHRVFMGETNARSQGPDEVSVATGFGNEFTAVCKATGNDNIDPVVANPHLEGHISRRKTKALFFGPRL